MSAAFVLRPTCEVCDSSDKHIVLSRAFSDPAVRSFLNDYYHNVISPVLLDSAPFEIARCRRCEFHWQHYILNEAGMSLLYGQWINSGKSKEKRATGDAAAFRQYARQISQIATLVGKPAHQTNVLDHGMGWAYWCRMAIAFGFTAHGTELSEDRIAHARSLGVQVDRIDSLPAAHFDFINSEQSFEHIPSPATNLRALVTALRPGGFIRIAVPDAAPSIPSLTRGSWRASKDAFHPLEHINSFTPATLVRLGAEAGLRPVGRPVFPILANSTLEITKQLARVFVPRSSFTTMYFRKA